MGETISSDPKFLCSITGITISPKKTFCIVKIWMDSCLHQDPKKIKDFEGLNRQGCIFKKHKPNY